MENPPYHQIVDVCRMGVTYDSVDALLVGFKVFTEQKQGVEICWIDNKFRSPSALGYSDMNIGVRLQVLPSKSHICEVQFSLKAMFDAKMGSGHKYYEDLRSALASLEVPGHL